MKHFILAICSVLVAAQPAFAFEMSKPLPTQGIDLSEKIEMEEGAMAPKALRPLNPAVQDANNRDVVIGIIIGGIIGAIAADAFEDQHRPRRPHADVICYARNARGQIFRAIGQRPRQVQDRALIKCERNSYRCRPMGCEWADRRRY